jgi:hypothetical protein
VPELKSKRVCLWQQLDKIFEQTWIRGEIGRHLYENWPQFAGLAHRFQALEEAPQRLICILETPNVGDHLVCLGGKAKTGRSGSNPILKRS